MDVICGNARSYLKKSEILQRADKQPRAPLSLRRWDRSSGTSQSEPLFDQRGRHQVSSAKDQETWLGPRTPDYRGLSQGKYLVFCCLVKFAFQVMNYAWGKSLQEAWVWYWFFFFSLAGEGACQLTKIWGLGNYCVLSWALHLAIKTWRFPVF